MLELGIFVAGYLVYWMAARPGDLDFGSQWAAAYIGVHYGWSHLYDQSLIAPIEVANHLDGFGPFQHPPPDAWLAVPFLLLPLRVAGLIWQALMLAALLAAARLISPAQRWTSAFTLLSIAGFQPVLIALGFGTMSPVIFLLVGGTLVAMERGSSTLAGVLLGLTALKPQLTLVVFPVLLAAGYWKTALVALAVAAGLGLASIAVIGPSGTREYLAFLASPAEIDEPMRLTIKNVVGVGLPSTIGSVVVVLVTSAAAFRLRPRPEAALVLGVLSSLFVAQHLEVGDLVLWLLPIWLAFRAGRPVWLQAVAGAAWISGWFAIGLPVVCIVAEVVLAVAFVAATRSTDQVPDRKRVLSPIARPASAREP